MDHRQAEMQVFKVAAQLEKLLEVSGISVEKEALAEIRSLQQRITERKFRVAVVGEFNRGKSSLINVLLGRRVLPEDVLATTATINRITYGPRPRAYLVMNDGRPNTDDIPIEELTSYVTKLTDESAQKASEIKEAVVEYPTMLCYNDVDLIDTPGMNDVEEMNAVTVNRLENIDLTIVAVSALIPFGETEQKFVVQLLESPNICQIVFVVTYIDMVRQRDREKLVSFLKERISQSVLDELNRKYDVSDKIYQKFYRIFDRLNLYAVSSYDAMEALETGDMALYEKSGYVRFTADLPNIILSGRSDLLVKNIVSRLEMLVDTISGKVCCQKVRLAVLKELNKILLNEVTYASISLRELNAELDSIVSRELFDEKNEGERLARGLLRSLSSVTEFTPDAIRMAMLPRMEYEVKRVGQEFREKQRRIVKTILLELQKKMGPIPERKKLKASGFASQAQIAETDLDPLMKDLEQKYSNVWVEKCYFGWSISPINSVINTPPNRSVLPGLIELSQKSLKDHNVKFQKKAANLCEQMIAEAEQTIKSSKGEMILRAQRLEREICGTDRLYRQLEEMKRQCSCISEDG